ncbi:SRPBCC domain-containing protein [Cohnella zeiphila]|uniref:SRPBCC domain-containing protein n=1 Tax=Cohnella zeiphila TaxID=2761120 RepID=A0A7X0SKA1_9BACL|nr:SRPBCC domain-containing protein [Cohnella zeiphila]MBB6731537.1 SRPBCC domain-containing protein [Cohnella zeiphila]
MTADRIEKDIRIAAPVEQVWAVVTERRHMEEWFTHGARLRELDLRPGGRLVLDQEAMNATTIARIVTLDPPHVFSYRWAMAYPGSEPTEENSTLVEFRLTADGDATLLQVTESGFANLVIPAEQEACAGPEAHSQGWPIYLEEIRKRTEEFALK